MTDNPTAKRWRDVAILVVVAAVFAGSMVMFRLAFGVASPWFGLMLMLVILGLIAFARPLFPLKLPAFVRRLRGFETRGALYRALRVPAFGAMLRRTALRSLNPMVYLSRRSDPDDVAVVLAQLESAEAAHYLAAAVLVPYMVHAGMENRWSVVAWFTAAQIIFNLYPILHLRWVRVRLDRLHERRPGRVGT